MLQCLTYSLPAWKEVAAESHLATVRETNVKTELMYTQVDRGKWQNKRSSPAHTSRLLTDFLDKMGKWHISPVVEVSLIEVCCCWLPKVPDHLTSHSAGREE